MIVDRFSVYVAILKPAHLACPGDFLPAWGWEVQFDARRLKFHVKPVWDIHRHWFTDCECVPTLDDFGNLVHNAFDERERYEERNARPH